MKKNRSDEIYQCPEENGFAEFHAFPAERYSVSEEKEPPEEIVKIEEISSLTEKKEVKENKADKIPDPLKKTASKVIHSAPGIVTSAAVIVSATAIGVLPFNKEEKSYPYGQVIQENLQLEEDINAFSLKGEIRHWSSDYSYSIVFSQKKEEAFLCEPLEKKILPEEKSNSFTVSFPLCYGLDSYEYSIQCLDKSGNKNELYSFSKEYSIDQSYQATYAKRKPTESRFEFLENGSVQVEVETGFQTTDDSPFSYQIDAIDRDGNLYGTYSGKDLVASFTIEPARELYFLYHDIGSFYLGEKDYQKHLTDENSIIEIPTIDLSDDYEFSDDHFAISYKTDSIYAEENVRLELTFDNGRESFKKEYPPISEIGFILLDDFKGEIGNLTVNGFFEFQDDRLDPYTHRIPIQEKEYQMNYHFELKEIQADISSPGLDYIPIDFYFDAMIPSTYQIKMESLDSVVSEIFDINDFIHLESLPSGDGGSLNISVLDSDGNIFKEMNDVIIHTSEEINSLQIRPDSYTNVNPSDSVITYNVDGTINIYRNMEFSSSDPNLYYDSFLYESQNIDDATGKTDYIGGIHHRSRERVSKMENLKMKTYLTLYYLIYYYDGVYYTLSSEMPSGSIQPDDSSSIDVLGTYDIDTDRTAITIQNNRLAHFDNRVEIGSMTYAYDDFVSSDKDSYTLTIAGNHIQEAITIHFNPYLDNYDAIASLCDVRGEKYKAYTFQVTEQ